MREEQKLRDIIEQHEVVLFLKGTASEPRCGFSALAVRILESSGLSNFKGVDVSEDEALKAALKVLSDWPTIPQLYVRGEFLGGSDIMRSMYESGELARVLADKPHHAQSPAH